MPRSAGRRKLGGARNRSTDTLFPVTVPEAGRKAICHGKSVLIEIFGTVTPIAEGNERGSMPRLMEKAFAAPPLTEI